MTIRWLQRPGQEPVLQQLLWDWPADSLDPQEIWQDVPTVAPLPLPTVVEVQPFAVSEPGALLLGQ